MRLGSRLGMLLCCGTAGPRCDAMWICLGSAVAVISAEGNRSLKDKHTFRHRRGHSSVNSNVRFVGTRGQHRTVYSVSAVLLQRSVAEYLSTSRGSNWEGIACILCWAVPISWGFTAISWFLMSISCRCRSSGTKHTQKVILSVVKL